MFYQLNLDDLFHHKIIWVLRKEFVSIAIALSESYSEETIVTLVVVADGSEMYLGWISSLALEIIETLRNKWEV